MPDILGVHHVTAIAGDPQQNFDSYAGVLGLRLVKLTINYNPEGKQGWIEAGLPLEKAA